MSNLFDKLDGLKGGSPLGSRNGFTVDEKAGILVAVLGRGVKQTEIARLVGRTPARISEICNLHDWDGKASELKVFLVAVEKEAARQGLTFKMVNGKPTFTK